MPWVILAAMLTCAVNIAVFAAFSHSFRPPIGRDCRIQAGLCDPTTWHCALWAAKAARSRQKRQRSGKVDGKNGMI
jgi:hypothetical protein